MNRRLSITALACLVFFLGSRVFGQLQAPVPPVNIIIDSDMSNSVDDVGDHAMLWALVNRGEVKVLAEVCSSANDYSAPLMHVIATYYGHPNVLIGAHQGSTPNLENSATSNYAQQMVNKFGIPGDTRANYPDAVTVYRQALANAPDHSVYIVANGYFEPLQGLLQSPADSISPLTGVQLVAQKVVRLVVGAGFFPSGNEHNMRVDADAASFLYANWPAPAQIVNVGVEVSESVFTGPDFSSSTTTDPIKASYIQSNGGNPIPGFGQVPLLFAVRGLGSNFTVPGLNGQTTVENFSQPTPGQNNWFSTPQVGDSYLAAQATTAQLEAILNPLVQSSSNMPILNSISPSSVQAGGSGQTIALTGTNFFSDSQVQFNGSNRPTTFVSATQLTVQLSSGDLAQAGSQSLSVANTEGGGWSSNAVNLTITAINPVLTGISPSSAVAGSGPVTLTATGSNFVSASTVQVNGGNRSTTFVSSTQLTATLTAADLAVAGSLSIAVNTPLSGGGTSAAVSFTVNNPVPTLASISPGSVAAGGAAFTLTVNGGNFVSGSLVQVNGSGRPTTFVSATQLAATVSASDIASPGNLSVTVNNGAPGGGTSSGVTLAVTNPVPSLANISPNSATAGSGAITLTVNGGNFVSGSTVLVNGSNRTTTFVNGTQLKAAIPASDLATGAFLSITVFTPAPGGGTSSPATFTVNNPVPSISSISPNPVLALGGNFTLTVTGSGFVNGSVVQFDGSPRPTTFVSPTQVTAQISGHDIIAIGQHAITVVNPTPGGGTSNSSTLTVISLL